jgi:hypothetical protein
MPNTSMVLAAWRNSKKPTISVTGKKIYTYSFLLGQLELQRKGSKEKRQTGTQLNCSTTTIWEWGVGIGTITMNQEKAWLSSVEFF